MSRHALAASDPADGAGLRRDAHTQGAVWLPGLLPTRVVRKLARAVDGWLTELGWQDADGHPLVATPAYDAPDFIRLQQWAYPSEPFDAIRHHPALVGVVQALMDGPVVGGRGDLVRVMAMGDPPEGTPPHQDAFYVRDEPVLWTAWVPLVHTPLALGPLAVWPGSHRRGLLPHHGEGIGTQGIEVPDGAWWWTQAMEPGDVLLFGGHTVHRSMPHTAPGAWRRSADFRYVPASR